MSSGFAFPAPACHNWRHLYFLLQQANLLKFTAIYIFIFAMLMTGCNGGGRYSQRYDTFSEYNKINVRNKSWFPGEIIGKDAHDLRSDSYLDELSAFGRFAFTDHSFYDSVFNRHASVSEAIFDSKIKLHADRVPSWFIKPAETNHHAVIQLRRMYLLKKESFIYFILSD